MLKILLQAFDTIDVLLTSMGIKKCMEYTGRCLTAPAQHVITASAVPTYEMIEGTQ